MSTQPSVFYTAPQHIPRVMSDNEQSNPLGNVYDSWSLPLGVNKPGDFLNPTTLPPHHQIHTHIDPRYPDVPHFLQLSRQYPWQGRSVYNTPTDLGSDGFVTAIQPGIVPQDHPHQAGTQQENVPWHSFAIPGAVTPSTRPANSPVESNTNLRCGWANCRSRPTFNRWEDLSRHIKTIHVFPASHVCLFCDKTCNRKDNLVEHQLRTHRFQ